MYVRGYLQGSENGRVVTIAHSDLHLKVAYLAVLFNRNVWRYQRHNQMSLSKKDRQHIGQKKKKTKGQTTINKA